MRLRALFPILVAVAGMGQTPFDIPGLPAAGEKGIFKPMSSLDWPRIEESAQSLSRYRGAVEVNSGDFSGEFAKGFFTAVLTGIEVKKPKLYLYMQTPRTALIDEVAKAYKLANPIERDSLAKKYAQATTFYLAADVSGNREAFMDVLLGTQGIRPKTPIEKIYLKTKAGVVQPVKVDGAKFFFPLDVIPENRWHRVYAVVVDTEGALMELDVSGQVMVNHSME